MVGLEANAGCVSSGLEVKLTVARLDTNGVPLLRDIQVPVGGNDLIERTRQPAN